MFTNVMPIGPHLPAYYKITIYLLLFITIKMIVILCSIYFEQLLIKGFFKKIKSSLEIKIKSSLIDALIENVKKEKGSRFLKKFLLKCEHNSYSIFKKEFSKLIEIARTKFNKYEIYSGLYFFYSTLKLTVYRRVTSIKSTIWFLLLIELFGLLMGFNHIAQTKEFSNKTGGDFKVAIIMLNDILFNTGIILSINLLLALIVYWKINRKYYFLIDETNKLIDQIVS